MYCILHESLFRFVCCVDVQLKWIYLCTTRGEFESDGSPDLNKDVYLQDIHCVSSLCKAYFRELPNPLLTYQLYDKFAVSSSELKHFTQFLMCSWSALDWLQGYKIPPANKKVQNIKIRINPDLPMLKDKYGSLYALEESPIP